MREFIASMMSARSRGDFRRLVSVMRNQTSFELHTCCPVFSGHAPHAQSAGKAAESGSSVLVFRCYLV